MKLRLSKKLAPYLEQIPLEERTKVWANAKSIAVVIARVKMLIQKGKIKRVQRDRLSIPLMGEIGLLVP
jgi:hypothetical protein